MARKVKIQLQDNIKRVVEINPDATEGAVLGQNLVLPDGRVVTIALLRDLIGGQEPDGPDGEFSQTIWQLIAEIPQNIQRIALLEGEGFAFRDLDGGWDLRQDVMLVRRFTFSFGDASPALLFDVERNLEVASACIEITAAFDGTGAAIEIGTAAEPGCVFPGYAVDPGSEGIYESATKCRIDEGEQVSISITPGAGATQGQGIATIVLNRR